MISSFKREPEPKVTGPLPSLALCIVTMKPELATECLRLARKHAKGDFEVLVWANACEFTDANQVLRSPTNEGVVGPMDALWRKTNAEIVAFIHDDLEIYEDGWDLRIRARFAASPNCALVGFGGARSLGRPDMWLSGSEWEPARGDPFMSNLIKQREGMIAAEPLGKRMVDDREVATIDGFAAVCRRTFLKQIDGFKKWPIVHHGYDAFLACMAKRHGHTTWLVPVKMGHPAIGLTSQSAAGLEMLAKSGGNYGLYLKAAEMIRAEFKDVLPFAVAGVSHRSAEDHHWQPVIDNYFAAGKSSSLSINPSAMFALDLLKRMLDGSIIEDENVLPGKPAGYSPELRAAGKDWPRTAHTMIGRKRLDNFQACIEDAIAHDVPGDIAETGVWRGGASILARGVLKAHGILGRQVWVCDSFEGLPPPSASQDEGAAWHTVSFLAVSLDDVKKNFDRYGLLDDQVSFVKGWFKDTLHKIPANRLAVLRLDGDMYESTMDALTALYPKVSKGGYVIVDDYHEVEVCRKAVHDYRSARGITEPIIEIDGSGVYWKREKMWWVPNAQVPVTMIVPTLTKEGAERTRSLIASVCGGSRSPDRVIVVDNGGHFLPFGRTTMHSDVTVLAPAKNLGVAASWNLALEGLTGYAIVMNDDAEIDPDTIERFCRAADKTDKLLVICDVGQGFPVFLIKPAALRTIGKFDELFFAYYEDTDYLRRMKDAGQTPAVVKGGVRHSETGGTSAKEAGLTGLLEASKKLFDEKWSSKKQPVGGVDKSKWAWRR